MAILTVTKALVELKLLDSRIHNGIAKLSPVEVIEGDRPPSGFKSVDEFNQAATSLLQSVQDLISRRQKIKNAIVKSNAVTLVTIGRVEMTVAEAIEYKTSVEYEQSLLYRLRETYTQAQKQQTTKQEKAQLRLDQQIQGLLGDKSQVSEIEALSGIFWERNKVELLDPSSILNCIRELERKIEDFKAEVDYILSESNSRTEIEVN